MELLCNCLAFLWLHHHHIYYYRNTYIVYSTFNLHCVHTVYIFLHIYIYKRTVVIIENLSGITAGGSMVGTPIILVQRPINPGLLKTFGSCHYVRRPLKWRKSRKERWSRAASGRAMAQYPSGPGFDSRQLHLSFLHACMVPSTLCKYYQTHVCIILSLFSVPSSTQCV